MQNTPQQPTPKQALEHLYTRATQLNLPLEQHQASVVCFQVLSKLIDESNGADEAKKPE